MSSFLSSFVGSTFPLFGTTLLLAVMVVAGYTFATSVVAGANGKPRAIQAARFGAYGTVALIGVAVLCLAYAFVSHDFRIRYVAHYSDRSMSLWYLLTALWGGQDGSLLWWLFLLSLYIGASVFWLGKKHLELQPYFIATMMVVVIFFCVLMAFAANPFGTSVAGARPDGEGLNPLLQNFYMIIHPPSLYVGFVGCTIPFAFAVAALITGRLDHEWIVVSRKWMLFAWMFLGIGNTLGMLWAYEELGWGGYWAWDPVENAAFMPFLTASAYVHSVMIQERRGMLKVWNVFLICLTFFMTIFGTFLTRSGAIASVHSFAQSSIGTYFVWFLVALAAFSITLVLYRWPELRDLPPTPRLRKAAIATGWIVFLAFAPGTYLLLGKVAMPAAAKVGIFALSAGAIVYVALEVVFRRMTADLVLESKRPRFESILSREFTFMLNNWGLLSFLLFVLVATTFPMITEAISGDKVSVGPPYYNAWVQPIGLVIFGLMGIGTLFGWKKTSEAALKRAFFWPTLSMVVVATLHFTIGKRFGYPAVVWSDAVYGGALGAILRAFNAFTPVVGIALCVFNAAIIVQEFVMLFKARNKTGADKTPSLLWWLGGIPGFLFTLVTLSPASRRRYGGYIVHLGIVLMFFGFTGKSWTLDKEATLQQGETIEVGDYRLKYVAPRMELDVTKRMVFADIDVLDKTGRMLGKVAPAKFIYKRMPESPTTEVAMLHSLRDDLYVVVGTMNPQTKTASLQFHVNPLVSFIWFGCIILIGGSIICMWPQLEPRESRVWAFARGGASVAASVCLGVILALTPARAFAQSTGPMPHSGTVHLLNDEEHAFFSKMRCMCGGCARDLLSTCPCGQADDARNEARAKLAAGKTQQQVLDEYVAQWGQAAMAIPPDKGAMKAIYALPLAAIAAGGVGLVIVIRRWRKRAGGAEGVRASSVPSTKRSAARDEYDARLDDELKDLDG